MFDPSCRTGARSRFELHLEELERQLRRALRGPLPGGAAQVRLAPRPRHGWRPDAIPEDCRPGAGLLLLFPLHGEPAVLLTLRHDDLPHHAGQVSLPGGALEDGESVEHGALREALEETGVEPSSVHLLGRLSPLHIPVSRFVLHPVVGVVHHRPALQPQAGEVERILEVPLRRLADPQRCHLTERERDGQTYEVPYLDVDGEKVWGATAMVLAEFLSLLGRPPDPWRHTGRADPAGPQSRPWQR